MKARKSNDDTSLYGFFKQDIKNRILIILAIFEACDELRGPSPLLSACATQLRRNVATVASRWRNCVDLTGPEIEPQTSRTDSVRLATELTGRFEQDISLHFGITSYSLDMIDWSSIKVSSPPTLQNLTDNKPTIQVAQKTLAVSDFFRNSRDVERMIKEIRRASVFVSDKKPRHGVMVL